MKPVRATPAGRSRLLDAAEALFAQKGYDGASLREITRAAGVELGLASYHFRNKDDLFRQALLRRAPAMSEALGRALDVALGDQVGGRVTAILKAYVVPHLEKMRSQDPGWRHYMRLAAHSTLLAGRPELTEPAAEAYRPIMTRFSIELARALPDVAAPELTRAYYIFRMALLSIAIDGPPAEIVAGHDSSAELDALGDSIVRIFAQGVTAQARSSAPVG